jgi:xylulokinase
MGREASLVGVDVGSGAIKCLIISQRGDIVAEASVPTPTVHPRPGWTSYRAENLWEAVCSAVAAASSQLDDRSSIRGIAVASVAESAFPVDSNGNPLDDAVAWYDLRTAAEFEQLAERIGRERLFKISGLNPDTIFGLCKLLWFKNRHPTESGRLHRWLNIADYICYRLCGEMRTDYSLAARTLALNLTSLQWEVPLIDDLELNPDWFPPLVGSGTPLGTLTREATERTRLPRATVVCAGGHDHICGAFGSGTLRPGIVLDSLGTSEALLFALEAPRLEMDFVRHGLAQGVIWIERPVYYLTGGIYTSGAAIEWFRRALASGVERETLIQEAAKAGPANVVFLPHLSRSLTPFPDTNAKGAFIGLTTATTRGELFRAVLEGLAFEARGALEGMLAMSAGTRIDEIRVIGGNVKNELFMQIKADVFRRPVRVSPVTEAVSFGAALLAGLGSGAYPDAGTALREVEKSGPWIDPDPEAAARYEHLYHDVYRELYHALMPLHHRLG